MSLLSAVGDFVKAVAASLVGKEFKPGEKIEASTGFKFKTGPDVAQRHFKFEDIGEVTINVQFGATEFSVDGRTMGEMGHPPK